MAGKLIEWNGQVVRVRVEAVDPSTGKAVAGEPLQDTVGFPIEDGTRMVGVLLPEDPERERVFADPVWALLDKLN